MWCLLGIVFIFSRINSKDFEIYNFNGHAYSLSSDKDYATWLEYDCSDEWYPSDITDQTENDAIASVLRINHIIGIEKDYWTGDLLSMHTQKIANYTNFKAGNKPDYPVEIEATTSKWVSGDQNWWDQNYYICESDTISPKGINITSDKLINLHPDDVFTFRKHTYNIYYAYRSYEMSRRICHNDHNGYLFIPNDGDENCAFHQYLKEDVYLGMTNLDYTFTTEKNYIARYLPWAVNNPTSEECVTRVTVTGEFITNTCDKPKYIMCETDGIFGNPKYIECNATYRKFYFSQIFSFNGSTYYIFDIPVSFSEAQKICSFRHAILYTPRNLLENCIFSENVDFTIKVNFGEFYLRGILGPKEWTYSNFTNWGPGYPVNDVNKVCVFQNFKTGKWENNICYNERYACVAPSLADVHANVISDCKNKKFMNPTYKTTVYYGGIEYFLFAMPMTFHESHSLCNQLNKVLINPTSPDLVKVITKEIKNNTFYINNRITWNDTTFVFVDGQPIMTPNWGIGQPKMIDEELACISISNDGTWKSEYCGTKCLPVCSNRESVATTSKSTSKKAGIGVGVFFAIVGIVAICVGIFMFMKKRNPRLNVLQSFGSFRKRGNITIEDNS